MLSSPRMRLLVVDDDAEWRTVIAGVLESEYDLVGFVERGDQIIAAAQKYRPEVITLDVKMPGESGLGVLPRLRALLPDAVIFIVSTTATPIYRAEALARGADGYVVKSRVLSELIVALASARERNKNRSEGAPDSD